ncbi:lipoprotein [Streptomyces yaanensis]|uniref:Lipoprotein n=1 Tax=Streptomyces yaanensis TaxID=1142239 RepID=A0ABV7SG51_9ACTN|nr:lipoprotein [Streptomyces sp. CGMCC 4.7035]WNB97876.1 lipoprotein [Streptomyces sp. CGMCC 4.7035]
MRRIFLVLCTAAALTGCSVLDRGASCTEADMDSGVAVVWRPADFGDQDAATIRLCVDGTCKEMASGSPGDPIAQVSVRLPKDVGATTVPVRLRVTSKKDGRIVVEDSRRARLTEQHPNGASCAPTAWTAAFRADPEKGLTSPKGMSLQGK